MAIARGAGTEIIRTALFQDVRGADVYHDLIIGEQHHIYTVLSVVMHCRALHTATDYFRLEFLGYDSFEDGTGSTIRMLREISQESKTFVWNDKFSFNGCEPATFTEPLSTTTEQDAIADQGTTTAQKLRFFTGGNVNTKHDIVVTYIDQNNA